MKDVVIVLDGTVPVIVAEVLALDGDPEDVEAESLESGGFAIQVFPHALATEDRYFGFHVNENGTVVDWGAFPDREEAVRLFLTPGPGESASTIVDVDPDHWAVTFYGPSEEDESYGHVLAIPRR